MVKLIVGERGSGKTKKLIDAVRAASEVSKGNVVCIEKGDTLRFDLNHRIRLIDINQYGVSRADAYYGFISGLLAGNYDITEVFGDATIKILFGKDDRNLEELADFVERVERLAANSSAEVIFAISCAEADLPERIRKFVVETV